MLSACCRGDDRETRRRRRRSGEAKRVSARRFCGDLFSLPQLWDISAAARLIFGALTLLAGAYFYRASARAIKKRVLSPDIAAAVILTVLYVLCAVDITNYLLLTATTVLLLLSRYAERRAVYALGASARRLSHMQPKTVHVFKTAKHRKRVLTSCARATLSAFCPASA